MAHRGKKYQEAAKLVDRERLYPPAEAADLAKQTSYVAFDATIEPDASAATYFWTAAAILPGARVRVEGLSDSTLQGDAAYPHLMGRMGASVQVSTGDPAYVGAPQTRGSIAVRGPDRLSPVLAARPSRTVASEA